jgi:hypothetical protein
MSEEAFNMSLRKFLKQVGVTSQHQIEEWVREGRFGDGPLKLRMVLRPEGSDLEHVVEGTIDLP